MFEKFKAWYEEQGLMFKVLVIAMVVVLVVAVLGSVGG